MRPPQAVAAEQDAANAHLADHVAPKDAVAIEDQHLLWRTRDPVQHGLDRLHHPHEALAGKAAARRVQVSGIERRSQAVHRQGGVQIDEMQRRPLRRQPIEQSL